MKHKSKYDIGERAIVVLSSNVEEYLKELSKNCFLTNFPKDFIDLLNENYDACINCISFSPALYFYLSNEFKKDKYIIKLTRKAYNKFNVIQIISLKLYVIIIYGSDNYGKYCR